MRMDQDRWWRLEGLFHEALKLESGERGRLVQSVRATDPELARDLDALLVAHDRELPLLDGGQQPLLPLLDDVDPIALTPGGRIGPYRVLRELGRGGMGVVYLAQRDDPDLTQIVALKCLPPGAGGADLRDRFLRERRILAGLAHPNIARLYDGGLSESGDPYFVMEYVEGEPLDRYCDLHRLSVDRRLALFETVCEAVQYAHEHLVVHRDLKPGNILVTADGMVKLLDFGVAKLLEGGDAAGHPHTFAGQGLTPAYASPEQARGEPVTAATDVFSLGLILFELLTGRRAFAAEAGLLGSLRAVVETEPARPSAVVREADDGPPPGDRGPTGGTPTATAAHARATTADRLRRRLRGDLDTIVEKALRKDPPQRYASVHALLDDLRRHRQGLPIRARPAGRAYRAGKFVRRHRVGFSATLAVIFALAMGGGAAARQGRIAAAERDEARTEAAKVRRVTEFLVGIFRAADPTVAQGESPTAREVLERGARRIETELAAEPEVQATVRRAVGSIYASLGDYDRARPLLEKSLEQHRQLLGPDNPEVAESLYALAELARVAGGPADSLFLAALDLRMRLTGPENPGVAKALQGLALTRMIEDPGAADTLLRRALAIFERTPGADADYGEVLNSLGQASHRKGDYEEAERLYRRSFDVKLRSLGEEHPATLATLSNLGWLLQLRGRLDAADSVLRRTLAIRRRVLGDRHTGVAATLGGLGEVAYRRGAYEEAERLFSDALAIQNERWPGGGTTAASTLTMLATVQAARGRPADAHASFREAIAMLERNGERDGLAMARTLNNRAGLFEREGNFPGATSAYRSAWRIYRDRLGADHAFTATVLGNIGSALLLQDSLAAAEPLLRKALEGLRAAYGDAHAAVATVLSEVGTVELRRGALREAESTLRTALATLERTLPPEHWRTASVRVRLGRCLTALGRAPEAEPLLLAGLARLEPVRDQRTRDYREAVAALAEVYDALDRPADARRYRGGLTI